MSKKMISVFSLLIILSMIIIPVSAKQNLFGTTGGDPTAAGLPVDEPGAPLYGLESPTGIYIVRLLDAPLPSYRGGVPGLAATSPAVTGAVRLDTGTPASRAYREYLAGKQDAFIADMEGLLGRSVDVEFRFTNSMNGLAVHMSLDEARQVADLPGVTAIWADELRELNTDVGPLLIDAPSIWNGNTTGGLATQGEDVIIGVLDTGVNSEHPSFADIGGDGYDHTNPYGAGNYVGYCDTTDPSFCNDKLIGAYDLNPAGDSTPEDVNGHGSHTASTAGGNRHDAIFDVNQDTYIVTIQGVAPHANIIAYEICEPSCPSSSAVAAIDLAIDDGVHVVNYSISGSDNPWNDSVDLAFLEAYDAGIFVSASAGNDGPGASTVAKTGPWNAAVAASTHKRVVAQTFDVVSPAPPDNLVGLAAIPGENVTITSTVTAEINYNPANLDGCVAFPAGYFDGQIALIQRGACTFATKVNNAAAADAIAVVVYNNAGGPPISMGGTPGTPPSVFLDLTDGTAVKDYIDANAPVTARINVDTAYIENEDWQDIMAGFSSRGPSDFDILKPDYVAPGVNILAAVNADGGDPVTYGFLQGTSMSSPHGAGSAALMVALHPDWSPSEIKSALATSADPTVMLDSDGATPADPFDMGLGRLDLGGAGNVGFIMHETYDNFVAANPDIGGDPRTLNVPGLQNWNCAGTCVFTRTIEGYLPVPVGYEVSVDAPVGVNVTVSPSSFELEDGEILELEITIDVSGEPFSTWVFGNIWFQPQWFNGFLPFIARNSLSGPVASPAGSGFFTGPSLQHFTFAIQNVPAEPEIDVNPEELSSLQLPNTTVEEILTINNTGGADLTWTIDEDNSDGSGAFVFSSGPVLPSGTNGGTITIGDDLVLGNSGAAAASGGTVMPLLGPSGNITITHSTDPLTIETPNTIACAQTGGGPTRDNAYLRVFELDDFGITSDFDITNVQFGVESATLSGASFPVDVNLYTLDGALNYANLTLIGTTTVNIDNSPLTLYNVPVTGTVQLGETLVVELFQHDALPVGPDRIFLGSNNNGQTGPSYIAADDCGLAQPTDMAAIGFPGVHMIMNVSGNAVASQVCEAPSDIPWLDLSQDNGTIGGGGSTDVTVTFDSTGLGEGVYEGHLCVNSNDADEPLVVVPVEMEVFSAGGWADDFDSYATDLDLHGVGGWKGWDNSPGASASTSDDQANSSPNSVDILGGADLVQEFNFTSGTWDFTTMQYIPSGFSGESYFILLNTYSDGGPYSWSVQLLFDSASGMVTNDGGVSGGSMAFLTDQWVEIRVEIDLDADTQSVYYNNVLLYTGPWSSQFGGGGASSFGAVDLFANSSSSVYYDDMGFEFVP